MDVPRGPVIESLIVVAPVVVDPIKGAVVIEAVATTGAARGTVVETGADDAQGGL